MKKILQVQAATVLCSMCLCSFSGCTLTQNEAAKEPKPKQTKEATVTTTPSGLSYKILQAPTDVNAPTPQKGDRVTVHYTGWLYDANAPENKGEKFDSSLDRNQQFSFMIGVGQVIQGWDLGVAQMRVGEQRRLIIPAELGYGKRGAGSKIPGGATLIFDVTLNKIESSNNK